MTTIDQLPPSTSHVRVWRPEPSALAAQMRCSPGGGSGTRSPCDPAVAARGRSTSGCRSPRRGRRRRGTRRRRRCGRCRRRSPHPPAPARRTRTVARSPSWNGQRSGFSSLPRSISSERSAAVVDSSRTVPVAEVAGVVALRAVHDPERDRAEEQGRCRSAPRGSRTPTQRSCQASSPDLLDRLSLAIVGRLWRAGAMGLTTVGPTSCCCPSQVSVERVLRLLGRCPGRRTGFGRARRSGRRVRATRRAFLVRRSGRPPRRG